MKEYDKAFINGFSHGSLIVIISFIIGKLSSNLINSRNILVQKPIVISLFLLIIIGLILIWIRMFLKVYKIVVN